MQTHLCKLQAWCRGGAAVPPDFEELEAERARLYPSPAQEPPWRADRAAEHNGLLVLGIPLGSPEHIRARARERNAEKQRFVDALVGLPDVQAAWLLLSFCAAPRANYLLRALPRALSAEFAETRDDTIWNGPRVILGQPRAEEECLRIARILAGMPARFGRLGLGDAGRIRNAAYWVSWADVLHVIRGRLPDDAQWILESSEDARDTPTCLQAAREAAVVLDSEGFVAKRLLAAYFRRWLGLLAVAVRIRWPRRSWTTGSDGSTAWTSSRRAWRTCSSTGAGRPR
ncbi:hypothetical protein N9L68_07405 [bacterium]|nr:hypothetical protein [bacterium]